jgi:hypothetical protein
MRGLPDAPCHRSSPHFPLPPRDQPLSLKAPNAGRMEANVISE